MKRFRLIKDYGPYTRGTIGIFAGYQMAMAPGQKNSVILEIEDEVVLVPLTHVERLDYNEPSIDDLLANLPKSLKSSGRNNILIELTIRYFIKGVIVTYNYFDRGLKQEFVYEDLKVVSPSLALALSNMYDLLVKKEIIKK